MGLLWDGTTKNNWGGTEYGGTMDGTPPLSDRLKEAASFGSYTPPNGCTILQEISVLPNDQYGGSTGWRNLSRQSEPIKMLDTDYESWWTMAVLTPAGYPWDSNIWVAGFEVHQGSVPGGTGVAPAHLIFDSSGISVDCSGGPNDASGGIGNPGWIRSVNRSFTGSKYTTRDRWHVIVIRLKHGPGTGVYEMWYGLEGTDSSVASLTGTLTNVYSQFGSVPNYLLFGLYRAQSGSQPLKLYTAGLQEWSSQAEALAWANTMLGGGGITPPSEITYYGDYHLTNNEIDQINANRVDGSKPYVATAFNAMKAVADSEINRNPSPPSPTGNYQARDPNGWYDLLYQPGYNDGSAAVCLARTGLILQDTSYLAAAKRILMGWVNTYYMPATNVGHFTAEPMGPMIKLFQVADMLRRYLTAQELSDVKTWSAQWISKGKTNVDSCMDWPWNAGIDSYGGVFTRIGPDGNLTAGPYGNSPTNQNHMVAAAAAVTGGATLTSALDWILAHNTPGGRDYGWDHFIDHMFLPAHSGSTGSFSTHTPYPAVGGEVTEGHERSSVDYGFYAWTGLLGIADIAAHANYRVNFATRVSPRGWKLSSLIPFYAPLLQHSTKEAAGASVEFYGGAGDDGSNQPYPWARALLELLYRLMPTSDPNRATLLTCLNYGGSTVRGTNSHPWIWKNGALWADTTLDASPPTVQNLYGVVASSFIFHNTTNGETETVPPPVGPPPIVTTIAGGAQGPNVPSGLEVYTLERDFIKKDVIDGFHSIIWTERYYGDSEVEILVPMTREMFTKLPIGSFLGLNGSDELMILETMNIENGKIKFSGISILSWLNNRFVRTSASHEDRYWYIDAESPGYALWAIVYNMCCTGSLYLEGIIPTGVINPEQLIIPELGLNDYDISGDPVRLGVPYGPVYNALRDIATTFEIGMKIVFQPESSLPLGFRSYKGLDRTSEQTDNPPVRFSPQMDSFTDIKELQSIAALKTLVYSFAPGLKPADGDPDLRTVPGVSALTGPQYTGFDLRALLVFAEDITTDQVGADSAVLLDILNSRANDALTTNRFVKTVDGEIVPDNQFQYGVHYNLGDIIEVEGNTGTVQTARVTEYIRAQDSSGIKAYPTVSVLD